VGTTGTIWIAGMLVSDGFPQESRNRWLLFIQE